MAHLRIRKQDIPIITFCIGIFVFPYILRERILGSLALINFLVYFGLIYGTQKKFSFFRQSIRKVYLMQQYGFVIQLLPPFCFSI